MIGETVRRELFGTENPVGDAIRVKQFSCEVIGLLASKGQSAMGRDQDDTSSCRCGPCNAASPATRTWAPSWSR